MLWEERTKADTRGAFRREWLKPHMPKDVDPIIDTVLKEMRGPLGCKKIGGVGYCFGGKYVCRYLKPGKLDAGYTAHPSFVDADELAGITGPLSIAAAGESLDAVREGNWFLYFARALADFLFAETDGIFPAEKRHESEAILPKTKQPYQMNLFSGGKFYAPPLFRTQEMWKLISTNSRTRFRRPRRHEGPILQVC